MEHAYTQMLYTMPGGAPNFVYNEPPPAMQQVPMQQGAPPPYAALPPFQMVPPLTHGSDRMTAQMHGHEAPVGQQMMYMPTMEYPMQPGMQPGMQPVRQIVCPTPQYPAQHPMHYPLQQHFVQPPTYHMPAPHHMHSPSGHGRPIGRPLIPHLSGHATKSRKKRKEAPKAGQKAAAPPPVRTTSTPKGTQATAPKQSADKFVRSRCIDIGDKLTKGTLPLGLGSLASPSGQKRVVPEASAEASPAPSATAAGDSAKRAKRPVEDVEQPDWRPSQSPTSDDSLAGAAGQDETQR